ncbi:prim-pol domain protein [Enterococcus phage vB_EfaS_Ef6.1]|nr:prim-pol domain protein [Enterococcus phage vB_EfaS_Ef6.1]
MELLRLKKNGKAPLVAGSFNGEDKAEVKKWVAEGGNYGILTGKISGIAVIDIDTHNGVSGAKNLDSFCEAYGIAIPNTKTVITPTGGMHMYFKLDEKYNDMQFIQNHKELDGVDFQTHGRYIVGWGSQIDGKKYVLVNNDEMADLPEKWLEMFTDKTIQKQNKKRERKWTANLLGDIIAGSDEGGRNNWITQMIGKLFATGLEHEEVWVWSQYVNQIGCNPPLDGTELKRTYESVKKREERRMAKDE